MNATQIKSLFAVATTPAIAIKAAKVQELKGNHAAAKALALQARTLKARMMGNPAEAARLSQLVGAQLRKCGL